jgi:hypothetical protein
MRGSDIHALRSWWPGRRFPIRPIAVAAAIVLAGCQFEAVTIPSGIDRPVVHGVLNPWATDQIVLVERTLTGRVTIDDDGPFNRNDPIVTGGGVPISGARVVVRNSLGDSVVAVEDVTTRTDGRGAGVYRFNSANGAPPSSTSLDIVPGLDYELRITTPEGDVITGRTSIPLVQNVPPVTSARVFNRDSDTLRLFWESVGNSKRYLIRIESPWGPMYLFTDDLEARLPGTLRNFFQENVPSVFLPGFRSTASVAAVDANYFDYFRSANDPFTGTGLITHLDGAVGVFGALAELYSYRLLVTADIDEPIEGRYIRRGPSTFDSAPGAFTLFVESTAGDETFLTGSFEGSETFPGSSLTGLAHGSQVSLALMRFDNDVGDTVGVFFGTLAGDSLAGTLRIPGRFVGEVRYAK